MSDQFIERTPEERRQKRCFHRVISGLEKGGNLRFLMLSSSDEAVNPIQRDFRRLQMRLKRRHIMDDYIRVVEVKDDGREHIHVIYRGDYLDQRIASHLWEQIHQSPVVHIEKVYLTPTGKRRVASYLAKYMAKESYRRYSWSWGWVYKGFVKTWKASLQIYRSCQDHYPGELSFYNFLLAWQNHLKSRAPPELWLSFLNLQFFLTQNPLNTKGKALLSHSG